jgi:hypothetical protein
MSIEHKTHKLSSRALAHLDGLLDEALEQTFPASDAVAIDIERERPGAYFKIPSAQIMEIGVESKFKKCGN